ncbi:DUF3418 domain-containing protein [Cystobacter fuscus]|uniref:DUF3418 domain-containing protein n=1 Tax=Cystobacter fuscus TaxID=43 RepID=UPI0012FD332F|nr:DUF3418 domain-containing protein [Cystobacter fuscus]
MFGRRVPLLRPSRRRGTRRPACASRSLRDQEAAQEPRWAFEELRVALFAPEVTTPVSVTVAKVGAALAALR